MKYIYGMACTSASHIFSNIGCAIKEHIKSKFPPEFFKYDTVSTEAAFRNIRRQLGNNTTNEITKRTKPYLVIRPIYSNNDDTPFRRTPLTTNFRNMIDGFDSSFYFNVLKDDDHKFMLQYQMSREVIEYEVSIVVSTLHQQLDTMKAFDTLTSFDTSYGYETSLESIIPRSLVSYMGKLCNLDIDDTRVNNIPAFLRHLNKHSQYPITYKVRTASANDEFFMYYNHKIIISFSDLTINEGNKKNAVDDSFEITFRVGAEFNMPTMYVLAGAEERIKKLKAHLVDTHIDSRETEFVPLFTLTNFFSSVPPEINGMILYMSSIIQVDKNLRTDRDELDLSQLFEGDLLPTITRAIAAKNPPETMIKIILVKNTVQQIEGEGYDIKWNSMKLYINNPDTTSTYRLIIYLDMASINKNRIEATDAANTDKRVDITTQKPGTNLVAIQKVEPNITIIPTPVSEVSEAEKVDYTQMSPKELIELRNREMT